MEACNAYYYATRDPLGAAGDFTTAPEISQMFGELVGAALADCWQRAGSPADAVYAELGPGRGTLAADALRVLRLAGFAGEVHLVETSPVLREALGGDPAFRGQRVTVCTSRCTTVVLSDWCACGSRHGKPTLLDLSPDAFDDLAPLSRGIVEVTIELGGVDATLPPTDTEAKP